MFAAAALVSVGWMKSPSREGWLLRWTTESPAPVPPPIPELDELALLALEFDPLLEFVIEDADEDVAAPPCPPAPLELPPLPHAIAERAAPKTVKERVKGVLMLASDRRLSCRD